MLIEFRVKNFYSIQDEQVFSLVASSQKEHKNNIFTPEKGLNLLKSVAIYGANAAGKTNLIKAFSAMKKIVLKSAGYQRGEKLLTLPFLLGDDKDKVSEFELSFIAQNVKYTYGFSTSQEQIFNEWLFAYPNGRRQTIFTREFDEKTKQYLYEDRNLLGRKKLWENSTRENALFLSTAIQLNSQQLKPVFDWFFYNSNISGIGGSPFSNSLYITIDIFKKRPKELLECLRAADLDIEDLKINEQEISSQDLPLNIPNEAVVKKSQNNKIRRVDIKTTHLNQQGKVIDFNIDLESDGTLQFFALLGPILDTLDKGKILIIDELEKHLHPAMTKFIIKLFHSETINKKNAQLIFTTHETSILHKDIFRKDQICFCEKQNKASKFYSLSDFKGLRENIDYEKSYLLGRFGALPNLREI